MVEHQRTPDEIRLEIERTRADMDETVQAIGERVSPGQIVDQLWGRLRGGEAARSLADVVKEHPMPALLMGLGLGWLVYERGSASDGDKLRRKYGDIGPGTYAAAEGRVGPYTGEQALATDTGDGLGDRARGALSSVRETASNVGEKVSGAVAAVGERANTVRERVQSTGERAGERAHHLRERTGERMQHARERVGELSHRARDGVASAYDEQPLALGAVAFGLGLASGLMVPSTRLEDETLGRRSDLLKEEVKRTGSETLESAKRVAGEAKGAARDLIEREGFIDDLKDKARHVVDETRNVARDAAEREGLSAEGLKDRTRSSAQRIRE